MGYSARLQGIFLALVGDSWHYNIGITQVGMDSFTALCIRDP